MKETHQTLLKLKPLSQSKRKIIDDWDGSTEHEIKLVAPRNTMVAMAGALVSGAG
jgi:hypothetical protein